MKKSAFISLLLTTMLISLSSAVLASKPVPKDVRYLLGMYYGNGSVFLVRENHGNLEIVYRTDSEDTDFSMANIFPLKKNHFDSYTINEGGPLLSAEAGVHFERDSNGNGVVCKIGGKRFARNFYPGEGDKVLRLEKTLEYDQLKSAAVQAALPAKLAQGQAAKLVPLKKIIPDARFSLPYAGTNNIFGLPLYNTSEIFMDLDAANALKRVSDRLAVQGYGLMIWEGYRPWHVSKLASDLLPKDKKYMLPLPEKGEDRNTGRTVDVSLYDLTGRKEADMISGFDEISVRQYPGYAGGTEEQRSLRDFLADAMKKEGFIQGKDEWWHFSFGSIEGWQHLNTPYDQIH